MSQLPDFTCRHCQQPVGNPHTSLDRQVVRREGVAGAVIHHILEDLQLFTYCGIECWHHHEPKVVAELALMVPYPPKHDVVPCSRCGTPVCRATPHVVYSVTTMRLTDAPDSYIGEVLHECELAVLCATCEDSVVAPSIPERVAVVLPR